MSIGKLVVYSGVMAGFTTMAALAIAARTENRHPLQPLNATSHWLHGEEAASVAEADLRHTGTGGLTHFASTIFWAVPFAACFAWKPPRNPMRMFFDASLVSAGAALIDYGIMPRRLTPGWELVLPARAVAGTFAAMALGLALGGLAVQRRW